MVYGTETNPPHPDLRNPFPRMPRALAFLALADKAGRDALLADLLAMWRKTQAPLPEGGKR